jgi:hypothetical protein
MLSQIFLGFIIDNLTLILKMKCEVEGGQCSLWKKKVFCNWPSYFNFWVVEDTCNLLYLYVVSANEQVAWVVELQLIVYVVQFIATQLQLNNKII